MVGGETPGWARARRRGCLVNHAQWTLTIGSLFLGGQQEATEGFQQGGGLIRLALEENALLQLAGSLLGFPL